jgi:hypothetical protein
MRDSGIPEAPSLAKLEERAPEIPGESPPSEAGGCKSRGNPELHRRDRRKVQDSRKLEDSPAGAAEGEDAGKPGASPEAQPEDAGFGETRNLIRRRCWKSEELGETRRFTWTAPPKDARFEETRRSIAGTARRCRKRGNLRPHRKADGTMHGPGNLRVHPIEAPETQVSGAFVFGLHTSGDLSEGAQGARRQVSLFPIPYPLPPFSDRLILDGLAAAGDKRLNQIGRLAAYIANHAYVTWLTACRSVR